MDGVADTVIVWVNYHRFRRQKKANTPSDFIEWKEGDLLRLGGGAGESYVDAKKARVFECASELATRCGVWGRCSIEGHALREGVVGERGRGGGIG